MSAKTVVPQRTHFATALVLITTLAVAGWYPGPGRGAQAPSCTQDHEPNNDLEQAIPLASACVSGTLSTGDQGIFIQLEKPDRTVILRHWQMSEAVFRLPDLALNEGTYFLRVSSAALPAPASTSAMPAHPPTQPALGVQPSQSQPASVSPSAESVPTPQDVPPATQRSPGVADASPMANSVPPPAPGIQGQPIVSPLAGNQTLPAVGIPGASGAQSGNTIVGVQEVKPVRVGAERLFT